MKNIFFILAFIATTVVAQAQIGVTVQAIDADDVPAAVISSQASYFPGVTVNVWEKQTARGRNTSGERYIANFRNNGQKARARYYANGTGTTAVTYYSGSKLPTEIQEVAATNYAGYTLFSGEQITLLPTNDVYYRLRLRSGAKKLVVYTDANGNELSNDEVPDEVVEEGE